MNVGEGETEKELTEQKLLDLLQARGLAREAQRVLGIHKDHVLPVKVQIFEKVRGEVLIPDGGRGGVGDGDQVLKVDSGTAKPASKERKRRRG